MQDDVRLELAQEWGSPEELVDYLWELASQIDENPLLVDKQLHLHVEGTGDNKTIYLRTL